MSIYLFCDLTPVVYIALELCTQGLFEDFFTKFSKRHCVLAFKLRKFGMYTITLYLLSMLQERVLVPTTKL